MPTAPARYCPACRGAQPCACVRQRDARRGSPSSRGYDRTWQRLRADYLSSHPLCADCAPLVAVATEVHHIRSIARDPGDRLDRANLMALCRPCHARRTRRGE
jgi:5-methylcytosine-specific restriction protein A